MIALHKNQFKLKQTLKFRLLPVIRHILEKLVVFLLPLPLILLIMGTAGIIKNDSPDNLASMRSMTQSFFNYFELHTLIIMGALGITLIVWFITRNIWGK